MEGDEGIIFHGICPDDGYPHDMRRRLLLFAKKYNGAMKIVLLPWDKIHRSLIQKCVWQTRRKRIWFSYSNKGTKKIQMREFSIGRISLYKI